MESFEEFHAYKHRERLKDRDKDSLSKGSSSSAKHSSYADAKDKSSQSSHPNSKKTSKLKKPKLEELFTFESSHSSAREPSSLDSSDKKDGVRAESRESDALSLRQNLGAFIESYSIQTLTVVLLVVDAMVSFFAFYFEAKLLNLTSLSLWRYTISFPELSKVAVSKSIELVNQFSMMYYVSEMSIIYFAFGVNTVGHFGYFLDSMTIAIQLYLEWSGHGNVSRILNFFRLWRIVRVCNMLILAERDKRQIVEKKFESLDVQRKKLQLEKQQLLDDIARDKKSKAAMDEMLHAYKEEVDTLNEALRIAAMDIAEVAQADDDEGEELGDIDMSGGVDGVASENHSSKATDEFIDPIGDSTSPRAKANTLARLIQEPNDSSHPASTYSSISSGGVPKTPSGRPTFVIGDDGSYRVL